MKTCRIQWPDGHDVGVQGEPVRDYAGWRIDIAPGQYVRVPDVCLIHVIEQPDSGASA